MHLVKDKDIERLFVKLCEIVPSLLDERLKVDANFELSKKYF